jgi:hypothetical protein
MDKLIISHRLFLLPEEKKILQTKGTFIETVGACCPVWANSDKTSEPAYEIFVKYRVISGEGEMFKSEDGFNIYLPKQSHRNNLLNIKDGGSDWLSLIATSIININDKKYPVYHQIVISGIETLERSICAVHLAHTSSR